jgi:hypothetical protein
LQTTETIVINLKTGIRRLLSTEGEHRKPHIGRRKPREILEVVSSA